MIRVSFYANVVAAVDIAMRTIGVDNVAVVADAL